MNIESSHSLALAIAVGSLLLAVGHWFPWKIVSNSGLPRIPSYIYGTGCLLVAFAIWLQDWDIILGLFVISAACGAVTVLVHILDRVADYKAKVQMAGKVLDNDER